VIGSAIVCRGDAKNLQRIELTGIGGSSRKRHMRA
jgi:hypothetical protein